MMSPFVLRASRVLVITPSRLVREQITDDFSSLETLRKANVIPTQVPSPTYAHALTPVAAARRAARASLNAACLLQMESRTSIEDRAFKLRGAWGFFTSKLQPRARSSAALHFQAHAFSSFSFHHLSAGASSEYVKGLVFEYFFFPSPIGCS